jgi:hypothetical protein
MFRTRFYTDFKKLKVPFKRGKLSILVKNAISFGKKDLAKNFDKYLEASF